MSRSSVRGPFWKPAERSRPNSSSMASRLLRSARGVSSVSSSNRRVDKPRLSGKPHRLSAIERRSAGDAAQGFEAQGGRRQSRLRHPRPTGEIAAHPM